MYIALVIIILKILQFGHADGNGGVINLRLGTTFIRRKSIGIDLYHCIEQQVTLVYLYSAPSLTGDTNPADPQTCRKLREQIVQCRQSAAIRRSKSYHAARQLHDCRKSSHNAANLLQSVVNHSYIPATLAHNCDKVVRSSCLRLTPNYNHSYYDYWTFSF